MSHGEDSDDMKHAGPERAATGRTSDPAAHDDEPASQPDSRPPQATTNELAFYPAPHAPADGDPTPSQPASAPLPSFLPGSTSDADALLDQLAPSLLPPAAAAANVGAAEPPPSLAAPGGVAAAAVADPTAQTAAAERALEPGPSIKPSSSGLMASILAHDSRAEQDDGALAALRTLPQRVQRTAARTSAEQELARTELLFELASRSEGAHKSRLLTAASELLARHGQSERARTTLAAAREADPNDLVPLRAQRTAALHERAFERARSLYEAEAQLPISAAERALAHAAIAELDAVQGQADSAVLGRLRDALDEPASDGSSTPVTVGLTVHLLRARLELQSGQTPAAARSLLRAALGAPAGDLQQLLFLEAGRIQERAGDPIAALDAYDRALAAQPGLLGAALGRQRALLAAGKNEDAVEALAKLEAITPDPRLAGELARKRAILLREVLRRPEAALAVLERATSVPALRERLRCAEAAKDEGQQAAALEAWAQAASGSERGVALSELASLHAKRGDKDRALGALREAALARAPQGLLAVVRDQLTRADVAAAGLSRAAPTSDAADALRAAAKLVTEKGSSSLEREALSRIAPTDPEAVLAEVLGFDAAAEMSDLDAMQALLAREFDRLPTSQRPGPALALLSLVPAHTDETTQRIEHELRRSQRGVPLVSRFLAARSQPVDAARLWLEEAAANIGEHAAFASVMAAHQLRAAGMDSIEAYVEALDEVRGHPPACFALEIPARQQADLVVLERVHRELATTTQSAAERTARRTRLGLLSAESDANDAIGWLELAGQDRPHRPTDALIGDLLIRLSSDGPARAYAERLSQAAKQEGWADFARAHKLRAAAALESAGLWQEAIPIYRGLLEQAPDDAFSGEALEHALRGGEQWRALAGLFEQRLATAEPAARAGVLEAWAELEGRLGDRTQHQALLERLLQEQPRSLAALRGLARIAMTERDDERLLALSEQTVHALESGPERAAELRLTLRLYDRLGRDAEAVLLANEDKLDATLWHALEVEAAAIRRSDPMHYYEATNKLTALLRDPIERASYALRAAETLEATAPTRALSDLEDALVSAPAHPLALATLARLHSVGGSPAAAAECFARAAEVARDPARAAELFYAAGVLFDDELRDQDRAVDALGRASAFDIELGDSFARLRRLLLARADAGALLALYARKLSGPTTAGLAAELEIERANILLGQGDRPAAISSLRAAIAHDPRRTDALRTLAALLWDAGEHHKAAEALVQLARLLEADEGALSEVMFQLGSLYDEHLRDTRRAELAFTRAAALTPDDPRPVERLVQIWNRTGERDRAVRALKHLIANSWSAQTKEAYILELASTLEEMGELALAEQALEDARRQSPISMRVLRTQCDLYERQSDRAAFVLHLQRSENALRGAVDEEPHEPSHWLHLVELLRRHGREDGAALVLDAAQSCGVSLSESPHEPVHGLGQDALRDPVLRKLVTRGLLDPLRQLFREFQPELSAFLPVHLDTNGPLPDSESRAVRAVSELFGLQGLRLMASELPVCTPIHADPLTICVGQDLFEGASEAERFFLLARAVVVAKHGLILLVRAAPEQVLLVLHALRTVVRPGSAMQVANEREQRSVTRELAARLPPPRRTQLRPLLTDLMSAEDLSTRRLSAAAFEFGSRVALTVTGNLPAAMSALMRLRGKPPEALAPDERLRLVRSDPALRALLSFAISEAYLEARREVLAPAAKEPR